MKRLLAKAGGARPEVVAYDPDGPDNADSWLSKQSSYVASRNAAHGHGQSYANQGAQRDQDQYNSRYTPPPSAPRPYPKRASFGAASNENRSSSERRLQSSHEPTSPSRPVKTGWSHEDASQVSPRKAKSRFNLKHLKEDADRTNFASDPVLSGSTGWAKFRKGQQNPPMDRRSSGSREGNNGNRHSPGASFDAMYPQSPAAGFGEAPLSLRRSASVAARVPGQAPRVAGYETYGQTEERAAAAAAAAAAADSKAGKRPMWAGIAGMRLGRHRGEEEEGPMGGYQRHDSYPDELAAADTPDRESKSHRPPRVAWQDFRNSARGRAPPPVATDGHLAAIDRTSASDVTAKIGWLCSRPPAPEEMDQILSLCNTLAVSESDSKEAAKALRKEFKWGTPDSQKRAVKVWAMLMLNSSDRFRMQVAHRRFLEVLESTMTDARTSLGVKERLLDAWGMLAYHYRKDHDLSVITKSYNKVRPMDRAQDGQPLDLTHPVFASYQGNPELAPMEKLQHARAQEPPVAVPTNQVPPKGMQPSAPRQSKPNSRPHTASSDAEQRRSIPPSPRGVTIAAPNTEDPRAVAHADELHRLHLLCDMARESASLMIDALTTAGLHARETQDYSARLQEYQEALMGQIQWATSVADESTQHRAESREDVHQTPEENLVADMMDALEQVSAARAIQMSAEDDEREQEEERRATELSKVDYRLDRSRYGQDASTGDMYTREDAAYASIGGHLAAPAMMATGSSSSAASSSAATSSGHGHPVAPSARMGPRPLPQQPVDVPHPPPPRSSGHVRSVTPPQQVRRGGSPDSDPSIIITPTQPSAKALGKRRAISRDDFPEALTDSTVALSLESSEFRPSGASRELPDARGPASHNSSQSSRAPPTLPPLPTQYRVEQQQQAAAVKQQQQQQQQQYQQPATNMMTNANSSSHNGTGSAAATNNSTIPSILQPHRPLPSTQGHTQRRS
ncbi:unnamed protein product [Jaminaea pallidilutea]